MKEATLQRIVNRINEGKCLVILGPQLLSADGTGINALLNKYLIDNLGDRVRYYGEEGFLSFDEKTRNLRIQDPIEDFFKNLQPNDIYRKLAEIPFSMVINTSPDITLNKAFEEKGIAFDYDFYHKGKAPQEPLRTNTTFIYNIFGDYREIDSMILTFKDLYQYLFSIMGDNGLKIKARLRETQAVLFFGFSFDKWYFQLLLMLMEVEDKLLNSHDITQQNIKNFYHEEFDVEFFDDNTAAQIIEEIYQAKTGGQIQAPVTSEEPLFELYVSYAWGGASEEMVEKLESTLQTNRIHLIRDKRDLSYKELISKFMDRIGEAKGIVVVISDKYLKSAYCMYELTEIYSHSDFVGRIFPIVMEDAKIQGTSKELLDYKQYWKNKMEEINTEIKNTGAEAMITMGDEYNVCKRIYDDFDKMSKILKDMNSLTPEIHLTTNFKALIKAIKEGI
jgi:hypothetical protein